VIGQGEAVGGGERLDAGGEVQLAGGQGLDEEDQGGGEE
jgi:hypothetical protein